MTKHDSKKKKKQKQRKKPPVHRKRRFPESMNGLELVNESFMSSSPLISEGESEKEEDAEDKLHLKNYCAERIDT